MGHRQIRPIGKTTGGRKTAEISLGGANEATHREERRLSDLTLRGCKLTRRKLDELSWRQESLTVDTRREGGKEGGGGARVIGSACQTLNIRVFAPVSVPFCGRDASLRDAVCLLFSHGGGINKQMNIYGVCLPEYWFYCATFSCNYVAPVVRVCFGCPIIHMSPCV